MEEEDLTLESALDQADGHAKRINDQIIFDDPDEVDEKDAEE